jgi:NAD(P)-dependent dehydrogenase (short-subunit alcohol dehydrogenase family)
VPGSRWRWPRPAPTWCWRRAGKVGEFVARISTLGRMGEQHELDTAVVFLASPASSYIVGVTLAVDGAMSGH